MIGVRSIRKRMTAVTTVLVIVCSGAIGPAQTAVADPSYADITGAGSTWSFNAIDAWIKNVAQFGLTVNYNPDGSTAGRQLFSQNTVNFAASEIPYGLQDVASQTPPPSRGYAYMPDTAGGTTFMYNLHVGTQQITDLRLSGDVITKIFTNVITNWNDP
ncbi:MAG TPA: substrate-binding domain-containing protein, partial [Streptosporangiaceae bacterium]|nr:substrate-binding domain-containing protein [Streptosporangiaceae bacterium]